MSYSDFTRFWRAMLPEEKRAYAKQVGCTLTALAQISSKTRLPSEALAEKMTDAANGALNGVNLRPDELLQKLRSRHRQRSS